MKAKKIIQSALPFSVGAALLISCAPGPDTAAAEREPEAIVQLQGFLPNTVEGNFRFIDIPEGGTLIEGQVAGLLPGQSYGLHIREQGSCRNPDAPGALFNPADVDRHGEPGSGAGQHKAGTLPNIQADDNGQAEFSFETQLIGTGGSRWSVIGRSLVLHAEPDDFQTQPEGNVGMPIACGVIQPAGADVGNSEAEMGNGKQVLPEDFTVGGERG